MEEGWVQCDDCQGWVHQICGLFNKGNNKDDAAFHCPACLEEGLQTGRRDQVKLALNPHPSATHLSTLDLAAGASGMQHTESWTGAAHWTSRS